MEKVLSRQAGKDFQLSYKIGDKKAPSKQTEPICPVQSDLYGAWQSQNELFPLVRLKSRFVYLVGLFHRVFSIAFELSTSVKDVQCQQHGAVEQYANCKNQLKIRHSE